MDIIKLKWKLVPLFILLIVIGFGISSCCTKKGCSVRLGLPISFYNFTKEEADTIEIISYVKDSNFLTAIDTTIYITDQDPSIENKYDLVESLNHKYDYSVEVKATGYRVFLSDITLSFFDNKCNQCFLGIGQDYNTEVKSYRLNGNLEESSGVEIYE